MRHLVICKSQPLNEPIAGSWRMLSASHKWTKTDAWAAQFQVPVAQELSARLGAVLQVVYLIFNEGYSAETTGAELSREAIRLGRLLLELLQLELIDEPEVMGLVGLMLLQESRRAARTFASLEPDGTNAFTTSNSARASAA